MCSLLLKLQKLMNLLFVCLSSGALAMGIQVLTLMPLRSTMNYQYKYGLTFKSAIQTLYKDGGFVRFYRGIAPALIQGPLSRFGDTASNTFALALLSDVPLPVFVKTMGASLIAGAFRILLLPIDSVKTIMQVEGHRGLRILREKIKTSGPSVLFAGAIASSSATVVGHYPWFLLYNTLQEVVPRYTDLSAKLARNAAIGFTCSVVSDSISNSLRVLKTYKQASATSISYSQAIKDIVAKDGLFSRQGLFFRGLETRILANGVQGLMFSVLWKQIEEVLMKK
jgi:Mitochondrial carrier protein